jgi:hypothetical protein
VYDYGISTQMIIVPAICSSLLELLLVMTRAIQIQFPFVEKRFLKAGSDTVLLAEYSGSAQPRVDHSLSYRLKQSKHLQLVQKLQNRVVLLK